MADFTEDEILTVWQNAQKADGIDSNTWRKDSCGAWLHRNQYGQDSTYGWEIDHILPTSKGGTDHTTNLRALHWQNNRSKSDDFPDYTAAITSNGNINIEKKEEKTINQIKIKSLKNLYPNNKYIISLS